MEKGGLTGTELAHRLAWGGGFGRVRGSKDDWQQEVMGALHCSHPFRFSQRLKRVVLGFG